MPTSVGPNPSADNSIVFSYDVGDTSNSYIGEPTTNYIPNADIMSGWTNYYRTLASSTFTTEFGTTGYRFVNQPSWNGIYKTFNLPSTGIYTFSAWFRYNGGSANNNGATVYIYNYGGGDTAAALNKNLVGVWQRVSHTINVTSTSGVHFFLISYGGVDNGTGNPDYSSWEVTMPQIELKSHVTPFVNGTRSVTQGLLPLLGNTSINLSNVSFDSNAQIVFDGTDDYIVTTTPIPCNFGTGDFTIEVMIYPQSFISYTHMVALPDQNTFALKADIGNGIIYYYDPSFTTYGSTSGWTLTLNQWNHVVLVRSGNVAYAYLNGASKGSKTGFNTNLSSTQIVNIGNGGTLEHTPKKINLVKIYNTALTADQVQQNYRQYKSRFNLS
jgi:hypothetical protein